MPLITICPRCTSHLGLPGDVTPAAQVQCPICEVEFSLATVVPRELPQARLIDHGDAAVAAEARRVPEEPAETAQERLSALLRTTAQWRPASAAESNAGHELLDTFDNEPADAPAAVATPTASELKLGDSRLDQLLSDLIKDSGQPLREPESPFANQLAAAQSSPVEFVPSEHHEFEAEIDDEPSETYSDAHDERKQSPQEEVAPWFGHTSESELPADLRTAPRRKRKPKVLRMLLGVVLGGMIGIGLGAYGLLWLRGSQGDFLGIAQYLPPAMLPASVKQIAGDETHTRSATLFSRNESGE